MQARVNAMKDQNWAETDAKLREGAQQLSPELRDLLDKIFVADESKRITIEVWRGSGGGGDMVTRLLELNGGLLGFRDGV